MQGIVFEGFGAIVIPHLDGGEVYGECCIEWVEDPESCPYCGLDEDAHDRRSGKACDVVAEDAGPSIIDAALRLTQGEGSAR